MYRVAVVQLYPKLLDVEANLRKIEQICHNITADLIVLPELITSGYAFAGKAEVQAVSEAIPNGKSFNFFNKLSQTLDASVVYGFPELNEDVIYNSAALINPDGTYHIYRKTHLFYREKTLFAPGDTGFNVFNAKGGIRIGMMICFDWQFPEAARTLALKGAQIICHPANLVLPWCQQSMLTRSLENRVFSITANRIGTEYTNGISIPFTGQSQILNTKGEILARLSIDREEFSTVEINPEQAFDKSVNDINDLFGDRRPAFYTEIMKPK